MSERRRIRTRRYRRSDEAPRRSTPTRRLARSHDEAGTLRALGQRWMQLMRAGRYEEAWCISDEVLRRQPPRSTWSRPRHEQTIWDGRSFDDRVVLVRCYHGLGDTLQYLRFLPWLRRRARRVILWCQPELIGLVEGAGLADVVLPLHDGTVSVEFEVDVEIMELAHAARVTPDELAAMPPYLTAVAPRRRDLLAASRIDVGLVWRAGDWDPRRSLALADLAPLWSVPGVRIHALQRGEALREWRDELGPVSGSDDVLAAARAITSMSVLVSVDSMPAHLAGALGVPTLLILPTPSDWRWMERTSRSPWYPSTHLVRQFGGDWSSAVRELVAHLSKITPV